MRSSLCRLHVEPDKNAVLFGQSGGINVILRTWRTKFERGTLVITLLSGAQASLPLITARRLDRLGAPPVLAGPARPRTGAETRGRVGRRGPGQTRGQAARGDVVEDEEGATTLAGPPGATRAKPRPRRAGARLPGPAEDTPPLQTAPTIPVSGAVTQATAREGTRASGRVARTGADTPDVP